MDKNYFLPLSGADEIGASSYFVKLEGTNILLDCGARSHTALTCPNYSVLLDQQLDDYNQLDAICISHAHYDHIGSLFQIASQARNTKVYATKITKELMRLQLVKFQRCIKSREPEKVQRMKLRLIEMIIDNIIEVSVKKPIKIKDVEVTFYTAGHMAGACMIGIVGKDHKVLYTGDFSFKSMMGMNELNLAGFKPDILILNASYGYEHRKFSKFSYKTLEKKIHNVLERGSSVVLRSTSIAKHLDLFYVLKLMKKPVECYLMPTSEEIAEELSKLNFEVYSPYIKAYSSAQEVPRVVIGQEELEGYEVINVDKHSLHASIPDLTCMVYMCMPKKIFIVHTVVQEEGINFIDELENEGRYHGEIIQCHNEMTYEI